MGVEDLQSMNKYSFKRLVSKYINRKNHDELLESTKGYKKLNYNDLSKEEFGRKTYFSSMNLESARMAFRVSTKMIRVPANFPSQYRRRGLPITCPSCTELTPLPNHRPNMSVPVEEAVHDPNPPPVLSQSHLLNDCVAVSDIRAECSLDSVESISLFFQKVFARNLEIEDLDNYH